MNVTLKTIPLLAMMLAFPALGKAQPAPIDLGGGSSSFAINDHGQVVGASSLPGNIEHAFSWTAAGGMIDLTPSADHANALGVSSNGQVVGFNDGHAFSWTATGGLVDLGTFGSYAFAVAVNARGQVVGVSYETGGATPHPFLWTAAGGMVDLGSLGGHGGGAVAINASGQVVGNSTTPSGGTHAFLWTATEGMVDLGTLGGSFSGARAVSGSGQIVGDSSLPGDSEYHAFSWTAAGGMVDLHAPGASQSEAVAVNSNGQVVGWSYYVWPRDEYRGFSWTAKGGLVDLGRLGSLGTTETMAEAVNDRGQVVGHSGDRTGQQHSAFVWTATDGMVGLGEPPSDAFAVNASGQVAGYSTFLVSRPMGDVVESHATLWNTRSYNFRFVGVKKPPAFNEVVAGRAVSVGFSLGGNFGLDIFDEGSPSFEQIACGASNTVRPIAPTSGVPSGSVIYKPEVDRYAYATKTDRNWAGTCRSLTLRLNDGSSHVVYFSFK